MESEHRVALEDDPSLEIRSHSISRSSMGSPASAVARSESAALARLAQRVADMGITRPEVLRVVPAYHAFQRCGAAFRSSTRDELYHMSVASEEIPCFWSHSWHGGHRKKVLTLLTIYNGPAAIACGFLAALSMMALFSYGQLPGIQRDRREPEKLSSTWSLCAGISVAMLSFLFWRPQKKVFFDRICINETDVDLKYDAILSLAGMLKRSSEMLVLWDSSWSERLWCLFELAAFLKSKRNSKQVLTIRPTFLGPCSVCAFLGMSLAFLPVTTFPAQRYSLPAIFLCVFGTLSICGCSMAFRGYFRSVERLKEQLQSVKLEQTRSLCCDTNHRDAEGRQVICDREILKECVALWFGSTEAFEETVRRDVAELVASELDRVFNRRWSIAVSMPMFWALMDCSATHWKTQDLPRAVAWFVGGLSLWILSAPIFIDYFIYLTYLFRHQNPSSRVRDWGQNLAVLLLTLPALLGLLGVFFLVRLFPPKPLLRGGLYVAVMLTLATTHQVVKWLRNGRGRCGSVGCGSCLGKTGPWSMEVPSEAGSTGSTA
ncbi:unnamed protein product [Durusdinium trenchii]|uniref:TIR domain-containing protein n=2 Tax=Durusdinium trenchii TaxID=1381693 RepID=A0ABP0NT82_9DINO